MTDVPDRKAPAGRRYRFAAALAVAAAAACVGWLSLRGGPQNPAPDPSGITFRPDEAQRRRLEELRARLDRKEGRFANADLRDKSNARLFMYMAATSPEPAVVEASLKAVLSAYSSRSKRKQAPDADLDRVLMMHLRSPQASIAQAAFRAARIPLMSEEPPPDLVAALIDCAAPSEPAARRHAALQALDLLRPDLRSADVLRTFESALAAAEPHLVSLSLFALAQSGPSLQVAPAASQAALRRRVLELTEHGDPGVRGRALALLEESWWLAEPAPARTAATRKLADDHPYVRARAASLLAKAGDPTAIHDLIALVDDLSAARYELSGWTALDGRAGSLSHSLPGRNRVADSVLDAIRSLSTRPAAPAAGASWSPFVPTGGARAPSTRDLQAQADQAKSWYRREGKHIPRATAANPNP